MSTRFFWVNQPLWVFLKIGVGPPNHPFVHRVFHYFHHPFWGDKHPYFWVDTPYGKWLGILFKKKPKIDMCCNCRFFLAKIFQRYALEICLKETGEIPCIQISSASGFITPWKWKWDDVFFIVDKMCFFF